MYLEIFIKYLHFISIFAIVSSIVAEHLLLKDEMTRQEIRRVSILDGVYGLSAITLLAAGISLWFWVGKPAAYYSQNWVFHLKITLFVVVGLLSIYPTIFFQKNRKGEAEEIVVVPKMVKMMIRLELLILFILPFLASMMAKGIGNFGD